MREETSGDFSSREAFLSQWGRELEAAREEEGTRGLEREAVRRLLAATGAPSGAKRLLKDAARRLGVDDLSLAAWDAVAENFPLYLVAATRTSARDFSLGAWLSPSIPRGSLLHEYLELREGSTERPLGLLFRWPSLGVMVVHDASVRLGPSAAPRSMVFKRLPREKGFFCLEGLAGWACALCRGGTWSWSDSGPS